MNHLDLVILGALAVIALWDTGRRHFEDRKQTRAAENQLSSKLVAELKDLVPHLSERQKVTEAALSNFLGQMREVVGFTQEARDAQRKQSLAAGLGKKLP
jgi:hypothetical protein